jgi:Protein of unknown function (DUF3631)/Bifunctional DNA primase/polymerase, N-terminal/Primase C terminal 2 (PriCT-2)
MTSLSDLGDEALAWARNGFAIFACQPRGKKPMTPNGFYDATSDEAQICKWWAKWPDANIGLPTGAVNGILIVDVDPPEGEDLLAILEERYRRLPPTSRARTGKGRHLYLVQPEDCGKVSSSNDGGLDIRAEGGYVIAPRSVHLNGTRYEWDPESPEAFALAPQWLLDFARDRKAFLKALEGPTAAKRVSGRKDRGLTVEGGPAFGESAPARVPEPWSETGETRLRSALKAIPAFDRDTWLKVGFALHDLKADDARWQGREKWDEWSKTCPEKFEAAGQDKAWESFGHREYDGPRITVATVYHLAKEHGWRDPSAATADRHTGGTRSDKVDVAAPEESQEPKATFTRLAKLSPVEYDRARIAEAEKLGVRLGTLDDEVDKYRLSSDGAATSGRALSFAAPEPWAEPVDSASLLDAIEKTINRYVALAPAAAIAGALWCVHAHAFEAFYISPRLAIVSPEKRCGKSTLLRALQPMLPKALSVANITVAAMFRTVEAGRPTLLIDEADSFLKDNEGLRGIINSGHARDGQVIRLVGDDHEPRVFSTWCPVAIAAIGGLPGTIEDRSIIIQMRRRRSDERVARFRVDRVEAQQELARKAARWAADTARALRDADPVVPTELNDRAADNWRPLLAIADRAGGRWPEKARRAALELSAVKWGEADTMRTLLLADIRGVFAEKRADRLKSETLTTALNAMTDRPWPTFDRGRWMTPAGIARLLKPFEISSETIRFGEETAKGYRLSAFDDAFARYLPVTS